MPSSEAGDEPGSGAGLTGASSPIQFPSSDPVNEDDPERTPRAARSGLTLSAVGQSQDPAAEEDGLVKYIWGTTISLHEAMNDFRNFLTGFKIKYRTKYNADTARAAQEAGQAVPPSMPLYDGVNATTGERALYEEYLATLRQTGQTNLNLDALNLLAYPPTKRLYSQLCNYPQEVIPIMDQVLRDVIIEKADEALDAAQNAYAEGRLEELELRTMEEDVKEVEGRVFKVRPFGGDRTVNMRDLNPGGGSLSFNK
jgi:DNA replication licensing factor MCM4